MTCLDIAPWVVFYPDDKKIPSNRFYGITFLDSKSVGGWTVLVNILKCPNITTEIRFSQVRSLALCHPCCLLILFEHGLLLVEIVFKNLAWR